VGFSPKGSGTIRRGGPTADGGGLVWWPRALDHYAENDGAVLRPRRAPPAVYHAVGPAFSARLRRQRVESMAGRARRGPSRPPCRGRDRDPQRSVRAARGWWVGGLLRGTPSSSRGFFRRFRRPVFRRCGAVVSFARSSRESFSEGGPHDRGTLTIGPFGLVVRLRGSSCFRRGGFVWRGVRLVDESISSEVSLRGALREALRGGPRSFRSRGGAHDCCASDCLHAPVSRLKRSRCPPAVHFCAQ
jgi:hypothetical protein